MSEVTFGQAAAAFMAHKATDSREATREKHAYFFGCLRTLHHRPVDKITPKELFDVFTALQAKTGRGGRTQRHSGMRTARFARGVFEYARGLGWLTVSPMPDLSAVLKPDNQVQHHPALVTKEEFGFMMWNVDDWAWGGTRTCYNALRLLARVATRPGEVLRMEWPELNRDRAEWVIPAGRMKMKQPYMVPLSRQALAILEDQYDVSGMNNTFVFPTLRKDKPLSDAALGVRLRNLLIAGHVPHGFKSSFASLMNELTGPDGRKLYDDQLIDLCLSHQKKGVAGIYDRSWRNDERRVVMQHWADYIDELREAAAVRARTPTTVPQVQPLPDWLKE